jgi:exoribonuclease-2
MSGSIGHAYDAIVTGVTDRGSFVRTIKPPVDGMLVRGQQGVDVGDRLRVTLVRTDPVQGYIDFARA